MTHNFISFFHIGNFSFTNEFHDEELPKTLASIILATKHIQSKSPWASYNRFNLLDSLVHTEETSYSGISDKGHSE